MMRPKSPTKTTLRVDVQPTAAPAGARRGVLTVLAGAPPGMLLTIGDSELTLGRTDEASVTFEDESLSRRHARFFSAHGSWFVEDLESTNGTFVNGALVREPTVLEDGARIQLGPNLVLRFTRQDDSELEATRRVYEASVRDALTGTYNRHFLDERIRAELSYANRHGTALSALFVDADHFKQVNDTHGHAAGDAVLRALARLLLDAMRSEDIVARFGGEEFVVLVRGVGEVGVLAIAERVRASVEALEIVHEGARIPITVSVGVATSSPARAFETSEELLAVADAALYRANEAGRNKLWLA